MAETTKRLTINEVIAFNLARARRRAGWTQDDAADRLTEVTGKRWTKGTLGAAERSWETDRTREFNGDELVAFCQVFGQPLAYWFLPPDSAGREAEFALGAAGGDGSPMGLRFGDLLKFVLPLSASHEFVDAANVATQKLGMDWAPSRPSWHLEGSVAELEAEQERLRQPADAVSSAAAVVDEAKRRKVLDLLEEVRRAMAPEEFPPF